MSTVLKIGVTEETLTTIPTPSALQVSLQDIDSADAGRVASGKMVRDRVCGGASAKRKLEIQWPPLKPSDASTILQAISEEFFHVQYPDPYTGSMRTSVFYAGDRIVPMYRFGNGTTDVLWENISVNLIEQ